METFVIDLPDAIRSNTMLRLIELITQASPDTYMYGKKRLWVHAPIGTRQIAESLGFKVFETEVPH